MKPAAFACAILAILSSTVILLSTAGMLCIYIAKLGDEMSTELDQIKVHPPIFGESLLHKWAIIKRETDNLWREMVSMDGNLDVSRRTRRQLEELLNAPEIEKTLPNNAAPEVLANFSPCGMFFLVHIFEV
ncbi:unnamed protein product [Strongylus vulgaris]|uniref:Nematode cuticle collagen N-terminal domain-containing protein n=1 Tax=Strongylus vulgaris TaxID=40348 RepID=A0A3P7JHH8_STRVU|nr:unnamed protein product [Strongylus vulgaris]